MEDSLATMLPGQNFDPLKDFNFTGKEDDPDYEEYVPLIEKPEDYDKPAPIVRVVPAEERIASLFRGMPGHEKLLAHIIEYCAEQKDSEDVLEELKATRRSTVTLYSDDVICTNLVRSGAFEIITLDAEEETLTEEATPTKEDETNSNEATSHAEPETSGTENALTASESQRVEVAKFAYLATAEGLKAAAEVRAEVPIAQEKLFESDGIYLPIYERILEAALEEGLSKKAIDAMVDHDPICANPRRYSGYFVKALEAAEAMTFNNGLWNITDYGKKFLEEHATIVAE